MGVSKKACDSVVAAKAERDALNIQHSAALEKHAALIEFAKEKQAMTL